jgi:hypothetical protein
MPIAGASPDEVRGADPPHRTPGGVSEIARHPSEGTSMFARWLRTLSRDEFLTLVMIMEPCDVSGDQRGAPPNVSKVAVNFASR